jgi:hypothetical protein
MSNQSGIPVKPSAQQSTSNPRVPAAPAATTAGTKDNATAILKTPRDLSERKYGAHNHLSWPQCLHTIEESYIVVMKTDEQGFTQTQRDQHVLKVQGLCNGLRARENSM